MSGRRAPAHRAADDRELPGRDDYASKYYEYDAEHPLLTDNALPTDNPVPTTKDGP